MTDLDLPETNSFGTNSGRGNLVGIEPFMTPVDYASEAVFHTKLDGYMQVAQQKSWLAERSIVAFPEYTGTWLVVAGEAERVYRAPNVHAAMTPLAVRHLLQFIPRFLAAREADRAAAALFRIQAVRMARIYHAVFSDLARRYHVTIVAGSIVLPAPRIHAGQLLTGRGPLYNVSVVYGPDGNAHPSLVLKAFPIKTELPFTRSAPVSELPAFDTPAGRLGVLICADAWYPQSYTRLKTLGVEILVVPSFTGTERWNAPWKGYNVPPTPAGVDLADIGSLTEAQAWHKYALPGRIQSAGAKSGINVFLHGNLWEMKGVEGHTILVNGAAVEDGKTIGAAIQNMWL